MTENSNKKNDNNPFRVPLPEDSREYPRGLYNRFPSFPISTGQIGWGFDGLAELVKEERRKGLRVLGIDGFNGVDWISFQNLLDSALRDSGITAIWSSMEECFLPEDDIFRKIAPFLGGDDPLFGTNYPLGPDVFFDAEKIAGFRHIASAARAEGPGELLIFCGCGSGLLELTDSLWYVDLPKDYIQERARLGKVRNLGSIKNVSFGDFYKRSYFVDWPALNRLKRRLLPDIDLLIDSKDCGNPSFISGDDFKTALHELSGNPFRVRPWFYPGPWGGKYMQGHMGLDPEQPNIAWSFEEIVPENGIIIEREGNRLEFSFDWLMFKENRRVLGKAANSFGYEWPVRLDYLDTIDGGNLSTQVHPRPDFIRKNFGESYTQDETYYIVNSKGESRVYLGLTESCDSDEFKAALLEAAENGTELDIDRYVNSEPSKPHDLFLIPNGTVHCSGSGNLVLEISATPYIFTFKIYDYLRKDLEGNLRPLNIERAFENIRFERRENWVKDNLLAKPELFNEGEGWKDYILCDKPYTFYNIHRLEFLEHAEYNTLERGLSLNLVDGESIVIITDDGRESLLSRFETMLVPAAAGKLKIRNSGKGPCRLIIVYVKPGAGESMPLNTPG